jgi:hypothetical protein
MLSSGASVTNASGRTGVRWIIGDGVQSVTASGPGSVAATTATGIARTSCSFVSTSPGAAFPPMDTTYCRPTARKLRVAALFVDFPDL